MPIAQNCLPGAWIMIYSTDNIASALAAAYFFFWSLILAHDPILDGDPEQRAQAMLAVNVSTPITSPLGIVGHLSLQRLVIFLEGR
ncbi:hypothetical protein CPB84DRAFT_1768260 [Gymnopilus junonius]|uniref:Uncharacterized protein n=1 Tax=Gymnopilus junonius TaxID=109634 RepID=A0A9P5NVF0_GYMJU|nr:hypothetical protein CPB84DRAFT_1768260 [Gymnopilus junonius]